MLESTQVAIFSKRGGPLKARALLVLVAIVLSVGASSLTKAAEKHTRADGSLNLKAIRATIDSLGLRFSVARNAFTDMTIEQRRRYAGAKTPDPQTERPTPVPLTYIYIPSYLDWRNINGSNYVTAVRDQGNCGSCWVFGSVAMLESRLLIAYEVPGQFIDLSEQYVLSCIPGSNDCGGGYHSEALSFLINEGTTTEICFPYLADDTVPCSNSCAVNICNNLEYLDEWTWVTTNYVNINSIKVALQEGPVVTWMKIYDSFYGYSGGVYSAYGSVYTLWNHIVLIIGYDDSEGCWIAKNSWDTSWGEAGFFRISFDSGCLFGQATIRGSCAPSRMFEPGSIVTLGYSGDGLCNVPEPNMNFVAVSAGQGHALGLKSDESIVAWGNNTYGQCEMPVPNRDFVAVAGGEGYSLVLKSDSTIVAWGVNSMEQLDVPEPNSGFVAISAGMAHSLAIRSDGSVEAWGHWTFGECSVPAPNSDFIAVAAGDYHSLGLKANGSIVAWGLGAAGQCDVPEPNSDFIAISAGTDHSLGLKSNGSIVAWGWNELGQCDVPNNFSYIAVAGGHEFSLGLKSDSTIVAWGGNPFALPLPNTDFVAIAANGGQSLGLISNISGQDLVPPQIEVLHPFGGEIFESGDILHVFWIATDDVNVDSVAIEYSLNAGMLWTLITSGEPNDSLYSWVIPADIQSDSCIVQVTAWDPSFNTGSGVSAGLFTIQNTATGVDEIPAVTSLLQNYPNPFNPSTTIRYRLSKRTHVSLKIYSINGSLIRSLVDERQHSGYKQIVWDGKDEGALPVASGVYFYRLVAGEFVQTKKMILLR